MTLSAATRSRAATASLIVLLAAGVMTFADDPDTDFAAILIEEFGYTDLAIVVLQEAANDADRPKEARAAALLELAQLYMQLAGRETNPVKKEELSKKAEKYLKDFEGFGLEEGSYEPSMKIAGILRENALAFKREAEKAGLAEGKKPELIKKAIEVFDTAIFRYEKILKPLKEKYTKLKEEYEKIKKPSKKQTRAMDEIKGKYGTAWFQTLCTKQMKAEIMPEGESRAKLLKGLIEELDDDFEPEFMDWGLEFYGAWLEGVCHWNAAQYKEAVECCDGTLEDLEERRLLGELDDVSRKLYLLKVDVLTDWAVADKENSDKHCLEAITTMNDLFRQFPSIRIKRPKGNQGPKMDFYCSCLLKKAKAYARMGEYGKALEEASWIFKYGSAGWKNLVGQLVEDEEWAAKAETATAHIMTARQHMVAGAHEQALRSYKKGLAKASGDEMDRFGETAWNHTGMCYYNLNQLYEAAIAFGKFATLGGDELAKKGLFLRAKSLGRQFYASSSRASGKKAPEEKGPEKPAPKKEKAPAETREEAEAQAAFDSRLWLQAMLDFVGKFPNEDPDMNYFIAERYRVHGNLDKAMEWYGKVKEKSQHYNIARFRQPMVLWTKYEKLKKEFEELKDEDEKLKKELEGKIKLALSNVTRRFKDYVRWNKEQQAKAADPKLKSDLLRKASTAEELMAHSILGLVNLAEKMGKFEEAERLVREVIKFLEGFEEKYKHRKSFAKIHLLRIQMYAKLLDTENVEKELDKLKKTEKKRETKGKKSKSVRDALAIVANMFLKAAEKTQDPKKKEEYNNKAAQYFEELLDYDPNQKADMFIWVGDQFFEMGRYEKAVKMYREFLVKFGKAEETKKEDLLQVNFRLIRCYIKLKQYDKVIELVIPLVKDPDWEWDARRMLIDAYHGKGLEAEGEARKELFYKALKIINEEIIPKVKQQGLDWYKFKKKMIEIYLDMGEHRASIARIEIIDKDYAWGANETREELADMLEKYVDKIEDRKLKLRCKALIKNLRKPVEIPVVPEEAAEEPAEEAAEEPAKENADVAE